MKQLDYYRNPTNWQNAWLIIFFLTILLIIPFFNFLSNYLYLCMLIFIFYSFASIKILRPLGRNKLDIIDPGLLFLIFIVMTILPISFSYIIGFEVISANWSVVDEIIFGKVILSNIMLITTFTFVYTILARRQDSKYKNIIEEYSPILKSNIWIYFYVALFIANTIIMYSSGAIYSRSTGDSGEIVQAMANNHGFASRQIFSRLGNLMNILSIFAFGVLVSRAKNLFNARLLLFGISGVMFLYSFILFGSRGAATILLPIAAYADLVRWKGRLLEWRLFLFILISGWIGFHIADLLESFYFTGTFGLWLPKLFTSLEPRMIENPGLIINWVDNQEEPLRYGSTYLLAIKSLIPSQFHSIRVEPLSDWLVAKMTGGLSVAEAGFGVTFGAVTEGYLNGKAIGVAIQAIIISFIALLIRHFKVNKDLKTIGPLFYSGFILLSYKLYRTDTSALIKRMEWTFILLGIILLILHLVYYSTRSNNIRTQ